MALRNPPGMDLIKRREGAQGILDLPRAALKYSVQKWKFEAKNKKINFPVPHPWEETFSYFD